MKSKKMSVSPAISLSGLWFWGFMYYLFMQHWHFWNAFFWIYQDFERILK